MKNKIWLCVLLAGLLILPVSAQVITEIDVRGNQVVPRQDIMSVVFSRVGDSVLEEKINGDMKAIYAVGLFSDVSSTFEKYKGGTRVVFIVTENPRIDNIDFSGNTVYSTAELLALISTRKGALLNFKTMQEDLQKINDKYKKAGYMLARVVDMSTDEKTNTLRFKITEGIVEAITLEGNDSTKDYVILRELDTKAGSALNEETLKKDLRRIFNLGFFSEVTPDFQPGSQPDTIIIALKIKETRSSTVNFGGGYGEAEKWFGFADLSINNLLGTAQGLMIRGQTGQQLSTYQFKYTNPWFLPDKLGKRAAFTFRRWLTVGTDIYQINQNARYNGFDVSLGRPFKDYWNVTWTLGSELVSPYGTTATFEGYQSNTIGVTLSYDTRDFWLNPKQGVFYSLGLKGGWNQSNTDSTFSKLSGDANHFTPTFENLIFAFHLGAGMGFGTVPFGEKFWAGGANTVRGYYPTSARQGTRKIIANAEYRLNFSDMFQGVFFYDWGNAWDVGLPDFSQFISGWGPGVRITTPMGPIRLDYGVPNNKTFSEGIMHFSIGQAF